MRRGIHWPERKTRRKGRERRDEEDLNEEGIV